MKYFFSWILILVAIGSTATAGSVNVGSLLPQNWFHQRRKSSNTCNAASTPKKVREILDSLNERMVGSVLFMNDEHDNNQTTTTLMKDLTWAKPTPIPHAIVQPSCEEDVALAAPVLADLKQKFGLAFRIRSGGHHYNAMSSIQDGIVLDLSNLNQIQIGTQEEEVTIMDIDDAQDTTSKRRLAWVGPAVNGSKIWSHLVQKHHWAMPMGGCPAVNVGGFILGGGFSYWSRKYGLGCDVLVQARLVLPNGTLITANATNEYQDLFWAIRGAGSAGIGAIVTQFQVALFPTQDEQVYGMGKISSVPDAARFLTAIGERNLPGNAGFSLFLFPTAFFGQDFISLYNWYDTGMDNLKAGQAFLNETFHQLLPTNVAQGFTSDIKSGSEQSKFGIMEGRLWRAWNGFVLPHQNTEKVWTDLLTSLKEIRDQCKDYVNVEILLFGGAISDKHSSDTAYYWRQGLYLVVLNLGVPTNAPDAQAAFDTQSKALEQAWNSKIRPFLDGAYYNYPEQNPNQKRYFGKNLPRLQQIKKKYDPDNVCHHPEGILPSTRVDRLWDTILE